MLPTSARALQEEKAANFFKTCSTQIFEESYADNINTVVHFSLKGQLEAKEKLSGVTGFIQREIILANNMMIRSAIRRKMVNIHVLLLKVNNYCRKMIKQHQQLPQSRVAKIKMINSTELLLCHMRNKQVSQR